MADFTRLNVAITDLGTQINALIPALNALIAHYQVGGAPEDPAVQSSLDGATTNLANIVASMKILVANAQSAMPK